jgi:hypothetical protein
MLPIKCNVETFASAVARPIRKRNFPEVIMLEITRNLTFLAKRPLLGGSLALLLVMGPFAAAQATVGPPTSEAPFAADADTNQARLEQTRVGLPDSPGAILASNTRPDSSNDTSSSNDAAAEPTSLQQSNTSASTSGQPANDQQPKQTKRILGILPNFRAVSANVKLPPQSPKEKFITATKDSFDYSSLFLPAVLAGFGQATNATPEFHQGAAGYARYFWHSYVDQTIENYMVEGFGPIITHQDNRYYTLGKGGFLKRTGYALSRSVITRNDAGNDTFNSSEIIGAGAAAGISNFYYPSAQLSFSNTASKWAVNVGADAASFVFKEFWPDINNAIFHTKD